MMFGNSEARAIPSCARASAIRTAAVRTSRFCATTRRSRLVSCGSWNMVHHSASIGSATGMLGPGFGRSGRRENHDPGADQPGVL